MNLSKVISALRASGNDAEADWLESQEPNCYKVRLQGAGLALCHADVDNAIPLYTSPKPACNLKELAEDVRDEVIYAWEYERRDMHFERKAMENVNLDAIVAKHTKVGE